MPQNEHRRPQGCLNTLALVLASITFNLGLWACFGLLLGGVEPYVTQGPICGKPWTDSWIECTYGEEMDLKPLEDELQTPTSQERN